MNVIETNYWKAIFQTAEANPIDPDEPMSGLPAPLPALSADLSEAIEALGKDADTLRADVGRVAMWRRGRLLAKRLADAEAELKVVDAELTEWTKTHGINLKGKAITLDRRADELRQVVRWHRDQLAGFDRLDATFTPIEQALAGPPASPARPPGVLGKLAVEDDAKARLKADARRALVALLARDVAGDPVDAAMVRSAMQATGIGTTEAEQIRHDLGELDRLKRAERDLDVARRRWSDAQKTLDDFNAETQRLIEDRRADAEDLERNRDACRAQRDNLLDAIKPLDDLRLRYGPMLAEPVALPTPAPVEQTPPKSRKVASRVRQPTALPTPTRAS